MIWVIWEIPISNVRLPAAYQRCSTVGKDGSRIRQARKPAVSGALER